MLRFLLTSAPVTPRMKKRLTGTTPAIKMPMTMSGMSRRLRRPNTTGIPRKQKKRKNPPRPMPLVDVTLLLVPMKDPDDPEEEESEEEEEDEDEEDPRENEGRGAGAVNAIVVVACVVVVVDTVVRSPTGVADVTGSNSPLLTCPVTTNWGIC